MSAHEEAVNRLQEMLMLCEKGKVTLGAAGIVSSYLGEHVCNSFFLSNEEITIVGKMNDEERAGFTTSRLQRALTMVNGSADVAAALSRCTSTFEQLIGVKKNP